MTNCLILGGAGFIGSHIADGLVNAGHHVRVFDRPNVSTGNLSNCIDSIDLIEGDFTNVNDLDHALENMEVVIHLVSTTLPGTSNENPIYDVESNLSGSLNLLTSARKAGVKKIIFSSSGGTVYGIPKTVPITEEHRTDPICSYGITKLAIEKYLLMYRHLYGLECSVLRISNPYGERQRFDSAQGAVAVFLGKIIHGETIQIWGDGSVARDFLYIGDLTRAFINSVELTNSTGVFNIGSGKSVSLNELIEIMGEITGKETKVDYLPGRKMDVPVNYLDIGKAEEGLSWQPEISLQEGVRRAFAWMLLQQKS